MQEGTEQQDGRRGAAHRLEETPAPWHSPRLPGIPKRAAPDPQGLQRGHKELNPPK